MSVSTESIKMSPQSATKLKGGLLAIGVLGLLASIGGAATGDTKQFYFSYLAAFWFTATIGLGLFFFTILQHLVAARWSVVVRRIAESAAANLWLLALLFIPVAIGAHDLYHWTHEDVVAHDAILQSKEAYLNMPFFYVRAVFYLVAWAGMGLFFYKTSTAQDESGDPNLTLKMRKFAAPAVLVFALTISFAGIDWLMSLEPHWFSTMWGVYMFAGAFVSAIATLIVFARLLQSMGYLEGVVTVHHYHDMGKLLFAFTIFWTYIAFCQYFLIWYANIPEETFFYLNRWKAGWKSLSLFIVAGHFVLPFIVLLSRHPKRRPAFLALVAFWMMFMHYVDLYWIVMPVLHTEDVAFHWMDIATLIGVAGIFFGALGWRLGQKSLVPVKDPFLNDSLEFENV